MKANTSLKEFDVAITQDDIDSGVRGSPEMCALAYAVNRQVPECLDDPGIYVEDGEVRLCGNNVDGEFMDCQFSLSNDICEFIEDFDDETKTVKPFKIKMVAQKIGTDEDSIYVYGIGFVPTKDV